MTTSYIVIGATVLPQNNIAYHNYVPTFSNVERRKACVKESHEPYILDNPKFDCPVDIFTIGPGFNKKLQRKGMVHSCIGPFSFVARVHGRS
jgi:hypothetical protein